MILTNFSCSINLHFTMPYVFQQQRNIAKAIAIHLIGRQKTGPRGIAPTVANLSFSKTTSFAIQATRKPIVHKGSAFKREV